MQGFAPRAPRIGDFLRARLVWEVLLSALAAMSEFQRRIARPASLALLGAAALALAACELTGKESNLDPTMAAPTTPVQTQPLAGSPPAAGDTLGAGQVRIG